MGTSGLSQEVQVSDFCGRGNGQNVAHCGDGKMPG
jgi:hypothetical protein